MTVYYTKFTVDNRVPRATATRIQDGYYKFAALSLSEMDQFAAKYSSIAGARLTYPPIKDPLKSRVKPLGRVRISEAERVKDEDWVEVPAQYITVLTWMLKKQFVLRNCEPSKDQLHKLDLEIRAKVVILLEAGVWLTEDDLRVEFLHNQLRKIDLGRRSDLKWASYQDETSKERRYAFSKARSKDLQEESTPSPVLPVPGTPPQQSYTEEQQSNPPKRDPSFQRFLNKEVN